MPCDLLVYFFGLLRGFRLGEFAGAHIVSAAFPCRDVSLRDKLCVGVFHSNHADSQALRLRALRRKLGAVSHPAVDYILLYFLVQLFIQKLPVRIPAHESHPLVLILLYNISAGFAIAVLPG